VALCLDPTQETEHYTQLDERAAWFYEATATSAGMVTKTPGVGSVYLSTYKDKDGDWLDGATSYRLHVPANVPAKQFWSLTVYDVDTRTLIQNKEQFADQSAGSTDFPAHAEIRERVASMAHFYGMMAGVKPGAHGKPDDKKKPPLPVTPWGRYAKILLSSSEFLYVN